MKYLVDNFAIGVGDGLHWDQDLPETEPHLQEEEERGEEEEIGG